MRHAAHDTLSTSLATLSRADRISLARLAYALALKEIAAGNAVEQSAWRITNNMRKQLERLEVDA
jgi:hypothetical protein